MLDKLIDILLRVGEQIFPFVIIDSYEGAIHMRLGKKVKELPVGLHFIPLKTIYVDRVISTHIKVDTFSVSNVNVTTTDNKTVSVGGIIEYLIFDVTKNLIECNDAMTNAKDITRGIIADYLSDCTWEEVNKKPTRTAIKNRLNKELADIGIEVKQVLFGDIVLSKVFTVFKP
jgi:hypothetical protein